MTFRRLHRSMWPVARRAIVVAALGLAVGSGPARALAVGHTAMTFVDAARGNRQIPTEIYYPADAPGEGVPLAGAPGTSYPVVSVGHGFVMPWSVYAYLWEALAPGGYIVALPRTEGDLSPDHLDFGRDLVFVIAALRDEGMTPSSLFFDRVGDTSAIMGHSMGGGASFLGAAEDPSITTIVTLAAAETNPSAIAAASGITMPGLLFAGSRDCVTPPPDHQIPMYDALASDCRALVTVTGGTHCQFAEASALCELGELLCAPAGISRTEQHAIVLDFLRPWLAFWLNGDAAAWSAFQTLVTGDPRVSADEDCAMVALNDPAAGPAIVAGLRVRSRPSPARATTVITFELPASTTVTITVADAGGRRLRTLLDGVREAGSHRVTWDGRDDRARPAPPGLYFCHVRTGFGTRAHRLVLVH